MTSLISFILSLSLLLAVPSGIDVDVVSAGECSSNEDSAAAPECVARSEEPKLPTTISVVLPCAHEGKFALKTIKAVYSSTPSHVLREIVVVDDGSKPPLTKKLLTAEIQERYGVRVIRHKETKGLILSKKHGGDVAVGDIVVFFDCHVAPQKNWYAPFLKLIGENYRRIVVPVITDLDIDTWTQSKSSNTNNKCYLSLDADFKWFESDDDFVPVLSGGLLGISRQWWNETGGYDDDMQGWGGENIDQSLRSWLCGGEIMSARDSHVAHMWRKPEDPRTASRYNVHPVHPRRNRLRAAMAWYGAFREKMNDFPQFAMNYKNQDGSPWYGSIEKTEAISRRLGCKPLVWYFHRFEHIYKDGGLIPNRTFALSLQNSAMCLTFLGQAGTAPGGRGEAVLKPCKEGNPRQQWHGANRNTNKDGRCCSGLRAWNTDLCIEGVSEGKVELYVCNVAGTHMRQQWRFDKGRLRSDLRQYGVDNCIFLQDTTNTLEMKACNHKASKNSAPWKKLGKTEPIEAKIYREQLSLLL